MQIEMASLSGVRVGVPVNAEPGVDVSVVIESQVFKDWAADVDKDPKLFVREIHIQTLDMYASPLAPAPPPCTS